MKSGNNDGVTNASLYVEWKSGPGQTTTGDSHIYDLKPSADYDGTTDTTNNWTITDVPYDDSAIGGGTNLCKE